MGEPVSEYVLWRPAPPLRPYVPWYTGYREAGIPPGRHRGLPSPYLTVIVTLHDPLVVARHPDPRCAPGQYDTLVGGLHLAPALITHEGRQSGIQLAASPLGARALLGVPAAELAGADLAADEVLGPFAVELRERVLAADGWRGRFEVLDAMLLRRIRAAADRAPRPEVVHAWDRLLMSAGTARVSTVAADVGWSERYLTRQFGAEIGLSPKAVARVVRFDRTRRLLQRRLPNWGSRSWPGPYEDPSDAANLAAVAAACGYYDQAHLAREFGELAGCPPSRWLDEEFRNVQAAAAAPASR